MEVVPGQLAENGRYPSSASSLTEAICRSSFHSVPDLIRRDRDLPRRKRQQPGTIPVNRHCPADPQEIRRVRITVAITNKTETVH
jgi:hypothetical protein